MNQRKLTLWNWNSNNYVMVLLTRKVFSPEGKKICPALRECDSASSDSLVLILVQLVKNLPAMQEIWVQSLGWEDPLEKEMATHSSILAWRILWTEEPGGLQPMRSQRGGHDWVTNAHTQFWCKWSLNHVLTNTIKNTAFHFAVKGLYSQSYGFPNSHVWL